MAKVKLLFTKYMKSYFFKLQFLMQNLRIKQKYLYNFCQEKFKVLHTKLIQDINEHILHISKKLQCYKTFQSMSIRKSLNKQRL